MLVWLVPSGHAKEELVSLMAPAPAGCLHPLAHGPFHMLKASKVAPSLLSDLCFHPSISLILTLLPPSSKVQITQNNVPISSPNLTVSSKSLLHVR